MCVHLCACVCAHAWRHLLAQAFYVISVLSPQTPAGAFSACACGWGESSTPDTRTELMTPFHIQSTRPHSAHLCLLQAHPPKPAAAWGAAGAQGRLCFRRRPCAQPACGCTRRPPGKAHAHHNPHNDFSLARTKSEPATQP